MSSAVYTATTPAAARACVASMSAMRADAYGLRTKVANAAPVSSGSRRLSTYVAPPISSRRSSTRVMRVPTTAMAHRRSP